MANLRTNNLCGEGGRNAYSGSLFFDGDSSYLALGSGVVPSFGTGDFTIEFWINQGVNPLNYTVLISMNASTASDRFEVAIHSSTIHVYTDTGAWRDTGYAPVSGVYEHIVFQRDSSGNTLKMYANGEEKWSVSNTRDYDETFTETKIGSYANSSYGYFQGYLSNLRICIGHTVYSSNYFSPPTSPLTVHYTAEDDKTVLLCCQDFDNPIQEATGKTIIAYGDFQRADDVELITNGSFSSDLSSWTVAQGTWAYNAGKAHMTGTSGNSLTQNVTTVVGKRYRMTATVDNTANVDYNVGIEFGGVLEYVQSSTITTGSRTFTLDFTATSTTTTAKVWGGTAVTGYWDNVSVTLIDGSGKSSGSTKVIPQYGTDDGNIFNGAISMNTLSYMYFPTGRTEERGRGRGIFAGGDSPRTNAITFIQIQSEGNSLDFGDLPTGRIGLGGVGSSTRGVMASGYTGSPANTNAIDFITIAKTSNSVDFGDNTESRHEMGSSSNETRGIFGGGTAPSLTNIIDYITIATLGNAINFGDLTVVRRNVQGVSSPTRSIFAGGRDPAGNGLDTIDYITIASTGDATDFGDLTVARGRFGSVCSETRGVFAGGETASLVNTIDFITIASTGDATDFGDANNSFGGGPINGASNKIRGVFDEPYASSTNINTMEYVTIATTGNATNFGDQTAQGSRAAGFSDSHGGL